AGAPLRLASLCTPGAAASGATALALARLGAFGPARAALLSSGALRCRLAPLPAGALASRPWRRRLGLRRHLALSFHRSRDRSAARGRFVVRSAHTRCGELRFAPAAFGAAVAAVLTLLLHCRLRARALSRARRRSPTARRLSVIRRTLFLRSVTRRSRVPGRGATGDIIHRAHDRSEERRVGKEWRHRWSPNH